MKAIAIGFTVVVALTAAAFGIAAAQLPAIGAGALLYPTRHDSMRAAPPGCIERMLDGVGIKLAGWICTAGAASDQPTIVYLHGIADNRDGAVGVIDRFLRRGFNVIAYDSRAHGRSEGVQCTYGFFEKQDLVQVLDQAGVERAIVIGHSLGGAVALQAAAIDRRIQAVVSASTFADLRSVATERAPFVFTPPLIDAAFKRAERDAGFTVDDVSPVHAAAQLTIPVFIIHGALDRATLPAHSERVFAALKGSKKLWIVPDAGHNDVLSARTWEEIQHWLDTER